MYVCMYTGEKSDWTDTRGERMQSRSSDTMVPQAAYTYIHTYIHTYTCGCIPFPSGVSLMSKFCSSPPSSS